jgi:four helix bundle protein
MIRGALAPFISAHRFPFPILRVFHTIAPLNDLTHQKEQFMNKDESQSPPESPKTASDQSCQGPKKFDLEGRLIRLAVQIVRIADAFPDTKAGRILSDQLIRSGTSAALNYGEAQSAESKRDFVHKLKIVLKELRESSVALKIAIELGFLGGQGDSSPILNECHQLIAIFVKSIQTALKTRTT